MTDNKRPSDAKSPHCLWQGELKRILIKRRYQIKCTQRVSGITFIRYAQNRKVGKPNNFKSFASK